MTPHFLGYFRTANGAFPFRISWFAHYAFQLEFATDATLASNYAAGWREFVEKASSFIRAATSTWTPHNGYKEWPPDADTPPLLGLRGTAGCSRCGSPIPSPSAGSSVAGGIPGDRPTYRPGTSTLTPSRGYPASSARPVVDVPAGVQRARARIDIVLGLLFEAIDAADTAAGENAPVNPLCWGSPRNALIQGVKRMVAIRDELQRAAADLIDYSPAPAAPEGAALREGALTKEPL